MQPLPAAVAAIAHGAFSADAVAGGAIGAMIIGMQRAVFSNEAGIGSASIAHSAVRTRQPATEGLVALFEPFIGTIVICTLTALVIGVAMVTWAEFMGSGLEGVAMISDPFRRTVWWFSYPLAVASVVFAVSTMLSWSYDGLKGFDLPHRSISSVADDLQAVVLSIHRFRYFHQARRRARPQRRDGVGSVHAKYLWAVDSCTSRRRRTQEAA